MVGEELRVIAGGSSTGKCDLGTREFPPRSYMALTIKVTMSTNLLHIHRETRNANGNMNMEMKMKSSASELEWHGAHGESEGPGDEGGRTSRAR